MRARGDLGRQVRSGSWSRRRRCRPPSARASRPSTAARSPAGAGGPSSGMIRASCTISLRMTTWPRVWKSCLLLLKVQFTRKTLCFQGFSEFAYRIFYTMATATRWERFGRSQTRFLRVLIAFRHFRHFPIFASASPFDPSPKFRAHQEAPRGARGVVRVRPVAETRGRTRTLASIDPGHPQTVVRRSSSGRDSRTRTTVGGGRPPDRYSGGRPTGQGRIPARSGGVRSRFQSDGRPSGFVDPGKKPRGGFCRFFGVVP